MVPLADGRNFDITVRSTDGQTGLYRTLDIISASATKELHGRGTRVWRAVLLKDGKETGEPVALKDTWVDDEGQSEGAKILAIRNTERTTTVFPDFVDHSFLNVQLHGNVFLDDDQTVPDCTRNFDSDVLPTLSASQTDQVITTKKDRQGRTSRKVHYRIVFEEVLRPIHREYSLRKIFEYLAYATVGMCLALSYSLYLPTTMSSALHLMHNVGWVHRDISIGNLLVAEKKHCRLIDMEYSKKMDTEDEFRVVRVPVQCHFDG